MAGKRTKKKRDIYQEVTNTILRYLEEGTAPWRNPIAKNTGDGWPKNLTTEKRYRGVNVLLLSMQSWVSGYASDYWMTYRQASAKGGQVRKGEKGSLVTFWKMHETIDKTTGEEKTILGEQFGAASKATSTFEVKERPAAPTTQMDLF